MDLDEWEVIPSTTPKPLPLFLGPDLFVETDYFRCPATPPPPPPVTLLPLHHQQQEHQHQPEEEEEEEEDDKKEEPNDEEPSSEDDEPAPVEFKDIPISTEFSNNETSPALASAPAQLPATPSPFNWLEPDPVVFDRGTDRYDVMARKKELVADGGKDCAGFNLWSLVNGIGAICSFGVATAATLCVFAIGAASASDSGRLRPGPNIQFQIYSHDKRIKEVVQRATGLNHAVSAARGIGTIPRAQITFGGHYEGL